MMGAFTPFDVYMSPSAEDLNINQTLYLPPTSFATSSMIHIATWGLLLALSLLNWRGMLRQAQFMLPLLALIGWIFASALWSVDPNNTLHRAFHMMDHVVFATYLVQRYSWREMISLFTHSFLFIFILSVVMALGFPDLGLSSLAGYNDAWRGAFTEKNFLGAVAVMGMLISGYSLVHGINNRWYAAFIYLGQMFLIVMSRSATSAVTLMIVFSLIVLALGVSVHQQPVTRFFSLAALLVGAISVMLLFGAYDSIHEMTGRSADMTGRTEIWHYVLKTIQARPWFGYGYGFWSAPSLPKLNVWQALGRPLPHAHNEWLDATLQLGLWGLCVQVYCLMLAMTRAVRLSFVMRDGKALFCGLLLITLCVRGYAETVLTDPVINGWFWLVISYLMLAHMAKERASAPPIEASELQQIAG